MAVFLFDPLHDPGGQVEGEPGEFPAAVHLVAHGEEHGCGQLPVVVEADGKVGKAVAVELTELFGDPFFRAEGLCLVENELTLGILAHGVAPHPAKPRGSVRPLVPEEHPVFFAFVLPPEQGRDGRLRVTGPPGVCKGSHIAYAHAFPGVDTGSAHAGNVRVDGAPGASSVELACLKGAEIYLTHKLFGIAPGGVNSAVDGVELYLFFGKELFQPQLFILGCVGVEGVQPPEVLDHISEAPVLFAELHGLEKVFVAFPVELVNVGAIAQILVGGIDQGDVQLPAGSEQKALANGKVLERRDLGLDRCVLFKTGEHKGKLFGKQLFCEKVFSLCPEGERKGITVIPVRNAQVDHVFVAVGDKGSLGKAGYSHFGIPPPEASSAVLF